MVAAVVVVWWSEYPEYELITVTQRAVLRDPCPERDKYKDLQDSLYIKVN